MPNFGSLAGLEVARLIRFANIDKYVGLVITLITLVQSVEFNLVLVVVELFKF